ncbi:MAG TPA: hypothetical protein VF773_23105 [Verrucomicrobiae bacterium]
MTKSKIAFYLVLIFLAGAIAGGAVVLSVPTTFGLDSRRPPHKSPEEFANHFWDKMKTRLDLTPEQVPVVEPIFRKGFQEVRAVMDRSIEEVDAAIRRNHEEMGQHLNEKQREELRRMHEERQNFKKKRGEEKDGKPTGGQETNVTRPISRSLPAECGALCAQSSG